MYFSRIELPPWVVYGLFVDKGKELFGVNGESDVGGCDHLGARGVFTSKTGDISSSGRPVSQKTGSRKQQGLKSDTPESSTVPRWGPRP